MSLFHKLLHTNNMTLVYTASFTAIENIHAILLTLKVSIKTPEITYALFETTVTF